MKHVFIEKNYKLFTNKSIKILSLTNSSKEKHKNIQLHKRLKLKDQIQNSFGFLKRLISSDLDN